MNLVANCGRRITVGQIVQAIRIRLNVVKFMLRATTDGIVKEIGILVAVGNDPCFGRAGVQITKGGKVSSRRLRRAAKKAEVVKPLSVTLTTDSINDS